MSNDDNPFVRLRAVATECLRLMGAAEDVPISGVDLHSPALPTIIPIRFVPGPELNDAERLVVETIRQAGEPLQQKEIAERADLGLRTVQKLTRRLAERGVLLRHPTLGFYVAGSPPKDFPP